MKVLVLATDYPMDGGNESHRYIHVRDLFYQENGIDVTVLNFKAKRQYQYDGIRVIDYRSYKGSKNKYDVLITHQPNLRNHYLFLKKYGKKFPGIIFFFHGHEVLKFSKAYPAPYKYVTKSTVRSKLQDCYDDIKLNVWRHYIPGVINKSHLVFVSKWMKEKFLEFTRIPAEVIEEHCSITYNCVGKLFETSDFDPNRAKNYDFVTIRGLLDGSKYCIDVVNRLAYENPMLKFHVIGKGKFFDYNEKPNNVVWTNAHLNHEQIIRELQNARCALMPTRTDAQGLMMCEMATFGIPVITSDLPVCHEALDSFENVAYIVNEDCKEDIIGIRDNLESKLPYKKNNKYFNSNTSLNEVKLIKALAEKKD